MAPRRGKDFIPINQDRIIEIGTGLALTNVYNGGGARGQRTDSYVLSTTGGGATPAFNDSGTIDFTTTPGNITASVKTQCEIDSNATGIKLKDAFYDALVAPAIVAGTVPTNTLRKLRTIKNACKLEVYGDPEYPGFMTSGFLSNSIANNTPLNTIPGVTATATQYLPLASNIISVTNPSAYRSADVMYTLSGLDLMVALDKNQDIISPPFQFSIWYEISINGGAFNNIDTPGYGADAYIVHSSNRTSRNATNFAAHGYTLAFPLAPGASHNIQVRKAMYYDVGGYTVADKNLILIDSGSTNWSVDVRTK